MRGDNSNTRSIIDWSFTPDIQAQYDRVLSETRRLQKEFGIEPKTIEQRYQEYLTRKAEEEQKQAELAKLQAITGQRRPPPKWKV